MKSMLEPRQNPSSGILDKQECVTSKGVNQDLLWIPLWSSLVWVLGAQTGKEKVFAHRCYCPGIAFDLPARWFSRKTNHTEFSVLQGLHSHKHLKLQQTSKAVKELRGHRKGGGIFIVTGQKSLLISMRNLMDFYLRKQGKKVAEPPQKSQKHSTSWSCKLRFYLQTKPSCKDLYGKMLTS